MPSDTENESNAPQPVTGVDTGSGERIDVEAVHKRIIELKAELVAEIRKLGDEGQHETNMAHSYIDSMYMWVKKRVSDLI